MHVHAALPQALRDRRVHGVEVDEPPDTLRWAQFELDGTLVPVQAAHSCTHTTHHRAAHPNVTHLLGLVLGFGEHTAVRGARRQCCVQAARTPWRGGGQVAGLAVDEKSTLARQAKALNVPDLLRAKAGSLDGLPDQRRTQRRTRRAHVHAAAPGPRQLPAQSPPPPPHPLSTATGPKKSKPMRAHVPSTVRTHSRTARTQHTCAWSVLVVEVEISEVPCIAASAKRSHTSQSRAST